MDDLNKKAYIFGSIFTLANRLQVLGDKYDSNLTVKQWLLVASIAKNKNWNPTISQVSNLIGNSRQNVKKMAIILEREGYLVLEKDKDDARVLRISLTKKCQDYFKKREKKDEDFIEQLFDTFDSDIITSLYKGIHILEQNILIMEKNYVDEEKE